MTAMCLDTCALANLRKTYRLQHLG